MFFYRQVEKYVKILQDDGFQSDIAHLNQDDYEIPAETLVRVLEAVDSRNVRLFFNILLFSFVKFL